MPRTGRPKSENPKNIPIKIMADRDFISDVEFCCQKLSMNKSDVLRMGIKKIKAELENLEPDPDEV